MEEYVYDVCFIDQVEAKSPSAGVITIKIRGAWPNPAWKFDHEELEFSSGKVVIRIVGRAKKHSVAASVLTPFEHAIELKGIEAAVCIVEGKGGYTVKVPVKSN